MLFRKFDESKEMWGPGISMHDAMNETDYFIAHPGTQYHQVGDIKYENDAGDLFAWRHGKAIMKLPDFISNTAWSQQHKEKF